MKQPTHLEMEVFGFSLWRVSTCKECGKTKLYRVQEYYGKRGLETYKHLPKCPVVDEPCECGSEY